MGTPNSYCSIVTSFFIMKSLRFDYWAKYTKYDEINIFKWLTELLN